MWEWRGSGIGMLSHSRGSVNSAGLRHLLAVTQSPFAKLKGQSIFHFTWWLPSGTSPPPVGKSIRAPTKPHMFWFSVKILIFLSPAKIYNDYQYRAQTTSVDQQDFMTRRLLYLAKNMPK